jgi:hypothetical protein
VALLGIMIFIFVLTIHIPNLLSALHDRTRLTIFLRDLTLSAGPLAFGASQTGTNSGFQAFRPKLITVARFVIAISIASRPHLRSGTASGRAGHHNHAGMDSRTRLLGLSDRRNLHWLRPWSPESPIRAFRRDASGKLSTSHSLLTGLPIS